MKTDIELQEKINDCIQNKEEYVEWLCQNKTEKQLEKLEKKLDILYETAVSRKIKNHVQLIELWKEQVNSAIINLYNFGDFYTILKKMKRKSKTTQFERWFANNHYEWFNTRLRNSAEEVKSPYQLQLESALINSADFIEQMTHFENKKLNKNLNEYRKRKEAAINQQNYEAVELLDVYISQVNQARILKIKREQQQVHS